MPRLPLPPIVPFLYLEKMHGLIEEKKLRRENLNIFVLSAEAFSIKNCDSELIFFFKLLSKNIHDSKIPTRFQLAIENEGHWFSVDCYIKNNQLYLLVLDASVNDTSAEIIKEAALDLNPIIFAYRGVQIQYDFEHCSFFTLDHLFRLSNRNQHWDDLLNFNSPARENIIYFDHTSSPNSLAFIFKNMQSFKGLAKLPDSLKNSFINENQTLDQLITKNSRTRNFLGIENKMNAGIILKEKKYMKRGANFFKPVNYKKIASSRQGFEVIGGEMGELIKDILTHKGKSYLKSFIKDNKAFIQDNIQDMFDFAIWYDLNNFLTLLIETKLLSKELITVPDICGLINQNLTMFKIVFEHAKDELTSTDISKIKHKINFIGNDQFKQYFSSVPFEETDHYSSIFLPF
jgi:hypothetical protein